MAEDLGWHSFSLLWQQWLRENVHPLAEEKVKRDVVFKERRLSLSTSASIVEQSGVISRGNRTQGLCGVSVHWTSSVGVRWKGVSIKIWDRITRSGTWKVRITKNTKGRRSEDTRGSNRKCRGGRKRG